MPLLAPILLVPLVAGLACLLVPSRRVMAALSVLAFGVTLALGMALVPRVLERGMVGFYDVVTDASCRRQGMATIAQFPSTASRNNVDNVFNRPRVPAALAGLSQRDEQLG